MALAVELAKIAKSTSKLDEMTEENISESNNKCKCYLLKVLKKHLMKMMVLTDVKRADIASTLDLLKKLVLSPRE